MPNIVKVLIGEINGDELDDATEHILISDEVPFDNSTNGFAASEAQSAVEEAKAAGISALARANHTGTQVAATISNFAAIVRATILTGLSPSNDLITAADSILEAFGKTQGQLNASVFGKSFQQNSVTGVFSTTSTSFVDIASITTPSLTAGTYLVFFYGSFLKTHIAGQIETQILEGANAHNVAQVSMDDDDYYFNNTSVTILTLSGVHDIAYQMRKANGGGTIRAKNRLLLIWRLT